MIDRFYLRFNNGECVVDGNVISSEESLSLFKKREGGLRVLLVNAPIRQWAFPNIEPIGLCYIASSAIVDGHNVEILDLNGMRINPVSDDFDFDFFIDSALRKKIEEFSPDVIGVGGIITQYSLIKIILEKCKSFSGAILILGGGIATCLPEFMMEKLPIDILVREEADVIFSEILYKIELGLSFVDIPNILYRDLNGDIIKNKLFLPLKSGKKGLDNLCWPSRHLVDMDLYSRNPVGYLNWETKWINGKASFDSPKSLSMLASRGCPYSCIYCYSKYLGCGYRMRSPKDVVDEMQYLTNKYNLSYIHFLDDLLMGNVKWVFEFFDELERRKNIGGFKVLWGGTCRANIISADIKKAKNDRRKNVFERGYEVGMRQACFGIESCSKKILKNIDKSGQTLEDIKNVLDESKRIFGYSDPSFMFGSPGETKETIQETIDFCKENDVDVETIFYITAFPATKLWDIALSRGLISKFVTGDFTSVMTYDILETYILSLGENSEMVRTNFSDVLSDDELISLGHYATEILGSKNKRHPHVGDKEIYNGA